MQTLNVTLMDSRCHPNEVGGEREAIAPYTVELHVVLKYSLCCPCGWESMTSSLYTYVAHYVVFLPHPLIVGVVPVVIHNEQLTAELQICKYVT